MNALCCCRIALTALCALTLACGGRAGRGLPYAESAQRIDDAITVLETMLEIPEKSIPQSILADARGIAVFPGAVKASLFFGSGTGQGVMSVRRKDGSWSYPAFIATYDRSIGLEFGVQVVDLVLLFKTEQAITKVIQNQLTVGVSASAAAGPLGRYASASTNPQRNAEIYSYARSRGLYLGVSLQGQLIRIAEQTNANFYNVKAIQARNIFQNEVPPGTNLDLAIRFVNQLNRLTRTP